MKSKVHLVVVEDGQVWIDGIKKRKPDPALIKIMQGRHEEIVEFKDGRYRILKLV